MSDAASDNSTGAHPVVDVVYYAAARLALVAVLTGAIYGVARLLGVTDFPIAVAVLFALIIAMPAGIWLFSPLRRRATASLAVAGERRRRDRERLQARLRGEAVSDPVSGPVSGEAPDEEASDT